MGYTIMINYSNTYNWLINLNKMNSLLFPGQGSQVVGMGSEFFNNFAVVKKIFEQANDKLGLSLSKIILEGP